MRMSRIKICKYILLILLIKKIQSLQMNDYITSIIPDHIKKSYICLFNTNMSFDFPTIRLHGGKDTSISLNTGYKRVLPNLYIIELTQEGSLEEPFMHLHKNSLFEPRATYIIITKVITRSLLNSLKKFYITKTLVITQDGGTYSFNEELIDVSPELKPDEFIDSQIHSSTSKVSSGPLKVGFMKKPPFVTCPKCKAEKGFEIDLFELVSKHLKLDVQYIKYQSSYWGHRENGSYTYLFKRLFERKFDVILGQLFDFGDLHFDFDLTPVHIIDAVQFVVPKARQINQYSLFHYIFERETIIFFSITMTVVFVLIYVLNRWRKGGESFLKCLQILFEVAFDTERITHSCMRFLFGFFMFSTIILNTEFKSKLFWALTTDHYEYQINSMEDVMKSNLVPVFNNRTIGYFYGDSPLEKFLNNTGLIICDFDFDCVDLMVAHRNVTTMKIRKALEYYIPRKYVDKTGRPLIHIIDYDVAKFHIRFVFVKGHPVFSKFNTCMDRLFESGIRDVPFKKLNEYNSKAQATAEKNKLTKTHHKLGLMKLMEVFCLYIAGTTISLIVFCTELAWYLISKKK